MPRRGFSLDGTRQIDRSAVEQEFFRQCGLSGIRMRDNSKGPSLFYFILSVRHNLPPISYLCYYTHFLQTAQYLIFS